MCKNCAKCGKGLNIGTKEAYNIKMKIRLGGISEIFITEEILEKIFT